MVYRCCEKRGFVLSDSTPPYTTLISIDDLAAHLDDADWCVFDCRFSLMDPQAGQKAYIEAHIAGARYVSLDDDLSTAHIAGETGRHPLPEKQEWVEAVLAMGLDPDKQAVVYDDAGGAMAARMWWMLRWIGHEKVALLNGGWQAWQKAGFAVSSSDEILPDKAAGDYASRASLVRTVTAEELSGTQQMLLDARELPRFTGQTEPLDPVAGHIPNALCSPFSANLGKEWFLKSPEELKQKFRDASITDREVVCYCGSGVTACHNILAMRVAGLAEPALYPGSWSEWIIDPDRPVATGD